MKKIFSMVILLLSLNGFSKTDENFKYEDDSNPWRFSYLTFEMFQQLPRVTQKEYLKLVRTFLVQQEMRKEKDYTKVDSQNLKFSLFIDEVQAADESPLIFPDDNGRCHYNKKDSKLSSALKEIIRNGRDQCVIAGQTVCMAVLETEGRIVCKLEKMPEVVKALKCSDENPDLIACGGLFSNKDGTRACVENKAGSTAACEKNGATVDEMVEYFKSNPNAKTNFEREFAKIRSYCGRKDQSNFIDLKDCEILNERLKQLENKIPDSEKTQFLADCTLKAREEGPVIKSELRFQYRQKGSSDYQIQASGKELKNWGTYDGISQWQAIDHSVLENSGKKSFQLARSLIQNEVGEKLRPNYSEKIKPDCKAAFVYTHGYYGKIKENNCVIQLTTRDGKKTEMKIADKSERGDLRFSESNFTWVPDEFPKLPDLASSPKDSKVGLIRTGKIEKDGCYFTVGWDLDGEPAPKKGSGASGTEPAAKGVKR